MAAVLSAGWPGNAEDGEAHMARLNTFRMIAIATVMAVSAPSALVAQNETPYVASRLIGRWRTIVNRTLEDSRAFASEDVGDLIEEFLSPGAVRAAQDKAGEEQLKRADAVVERFVYAAIKASQRQPDGSVIVEASAIEPAEKAICPVYPFCGDR